MVVPILVGLGIADLTQFASRLLPITLPFLTVLWERLSWGWLRYGAALFAFPRLIGHCGAVLAFFLPWVLIYLVSGREGMFEAWPLAIVGSVSYILGQWPVARYLGPYLPDLAARLLFSGSFSFS